MRTFRDPAFSCPGTRVQQAFYNNMCSVALEGISLGCCVHLNESVSMRPYSRQLIARTSAARGVMIESSELPRQSLGGRRRGTTA